MLIDLVANGARGCLFWHANRRASRFNGSQPFRTRPNHVHTYFIKYTAAEYATPKPDGNLTRLSPPRVRVWPARLRSDSPGQICLNVGMDDDEYSDDGFSPLVSDGVCVRFLDWLIWSLDQALDHVRILPCS